jgi:hypothetical protein
MLPPSKARSLLNQHHSSDNRGRPRLCARQPGDIASFQPAGRQDRAEDRAAKRAQRRLLHGWFTRALRLAHVAKDDSAVTDDRRISHVDGINSDTVRLWQLGNLAT